MEELQKRFDALTDDQKKKFIEDNLAENLDIRDATNCYELKDVDEYVDEAISNMNGVEVYEKLTQYQQDNLFDYLTEEKEDF